MRKTIKCLSQSAAILCLLATPFSANASIDQSALEILARPTSVESSVQFRLYKALERKMMEESQGSVGRQGNDMIVTSGSWSIICSKKNERFYSCKYSAKLNDTSFSQESPFQIFGGTAAHLAGYVKNTLASMLEQKMSSGQIVLSELSAPGVRLWCAKNVKNPQALTIQCGINSK